MIVVDSSVWIAQLRGSGTEAVRQLESIRPAREIIVGDVVLLEVLQGARDDREAAFIEAELRAFSVRQMLDARLAVLAARNFRRLRARGTTVRKTIDVVIATFCIEHDHALLQQDRDFTPMAAHLGLRLL